MQKQKGISTLVGIIIIVIVAVVLVGGTFVWQYFITESQQTDQTTDSPVQSRQATEDWKTYKNSEYGFEIKYPSGYSPLEVNNTIHFPKNNEETNWGITITATNLKSNETCDSEEYASSRVLANDSITSKQIFLNGISKNVSQLRVVYGALPQTILTYIPTQNCSTSKNMIIISGSENLSTQYNQLLSTFKFTK